MHALQFLIAHAVSNNDFILHFFMQEVTDELKNYESTLAALHEQAANLGEQDRESPDIQNRLGSIDNRYQELLELAKLRKQRLLDALSLYKLFNEADGVETWIDEKVCIDIVNVVENQISWGHFQGLQSYFV